MGLVQYDSDSDTDAVLTGQTLARSRDAESKQPSVTVKRKRTLPVLPSSYSTDIGPNDDPTLHQGRKRTRPYVDGDYDTHLYISLKPPRELSRQLEKLISRLDDESPRREVHSVLAKDGDLHISLAHPFPLRRSQITEFKADLQKSVESLSIRHFKVSLEGAVRVYYNGRRYGGEGHGGRAFFALRTIAGSDEINRIVQKAIHPLLKSLHRPLYHSDPEYHTSFAWCLTVPPDGELLSREEKTNQISVSPLLPIDAGMVDRINGEIHEELLRVQPLGGWMVDTMILKIGKDVTAINL